MAKKIIEEWAAKIGWEVDSKALDTFGKQAEEVASAFKVVTAAVATATAAAAGYLVATNRITAQEAQMEKALGLSAGSFETWGGILGEVGFEADKIGDLFEEMNNKIGESTGLKPITPVVESLKILNLEFKELQKLKPEEQFIKILSAAKELGDEQQARSAADILMGGDANRIVGLLRTYDGTLEDVLETRRSMLILDQEGQDGAVAFSRSLGLLIGTITSLGKQIAGVIGGGLTPYFEHIQKIVIANKELVMSTAKEWFEDLLSILKVFMSAAKFLVSTIKSVTGVFGGLGNTIKLVTLTFAAMKIAAIAKTFYTLVASIKAATVASTALKVAIAAWPYALAAALVIVAEDIYGFFTGKDSVTGRIIEALSGMFKEAIGIVEEYIGMAVSEIGNYFGFSKDEMDQFLLDMEDRFVGWVDRIRESIESVIGYFDKLWSTITGKSVTDIIDQRAAKINQVARQQRYFIENNPRRQGDMKQFPSVFQDNDTFGLNRNAFVPTVNQTPNVFTGGTSATNNITINQQPGQSSKELAREVGKEIEKGMARAVRSNSAGYQY